MTVSANAGTTTGTPWHLWLVGVVALLFNSIGAFDHIMSMSQGSQYMASAGMTPAQIAHYEQMPRWMFMVWATGVWTAMAGSVLILLRRALAAPVFAVSLAAFLISVFYHQVLTDGGRILGAQMTMINVVITALLILFLWYSRLMARRRVLR